MRYTKNTSGDSLENGRTEVAKRIWCSEVGYFPECDGLMIGETDEEVMRAAAEHGRKIHGMTDEQLSDPETQRTIRGFIREK